MAVTLTVVRRTKQANLRKVIVDVVGPASYTTGGETLTVAQQQTLFPEVDANRAAVAFSGVVFFDTETSATATPAFLACVLDRTNNKILYTTIGAQTTAATNLSAQTIRVQFTYQVSSG